MLWDSKKRDCIWVAFSKDLREMVISEVILGIGAGFPKVGAGECRQTRRLERVVVMGSCVWVFIWLRIEDFRILTTTFILLVIKVTCASEKIWKLFKNTKRTTRGSYHFSISLLFLPDCQSIYTNIFFKKQLLFYYDHWNTYFFRIWKYCKYKKKNHC